MEKLIEHENGVYNVHAPGYICNTAEFQVETDKADGSELQVVDESTHKVVSYHIAYNGHWNKR